MCQRHVFSGCVVARHVSLHVSSNASIIAVRARLVRVSVSIVSVLPIINLTKKKKDVRRVTHQA